MICRFCSNEYIECGYVDFYKNGEIKDLYKVCKKCSITRIFWPRVFVNEEIFDSINKGRRLISQGGFYIDGIRQTSFDSPLFFGERILKIGKRRWLKFIIKG